MNGTKECKKEDYTFYYIAFGIIGANFIIGYIMGIYTQNVLIAAVVGVVLLVVIPCLVALRIVEGKFGKGNL